MSIISSNFDAHMKAHMKTALKHGAEFTGALYM